MTKDHELPVHHIREGSAMAGRFLQEGLIYDDVRHDHRGKHREIEEIREIACTLVRDNVHHVAHAGENEDIIKNVLRKA